MAITSERNGHGPDFTSEHTGDIINNKVRGMNRETEIYRGQISFIKFTLFAEQLTRTFEVIVCSLFLVYLLDF